MICPYCKEKMVLKRFIDKDYDGNFTNERFVYSCEKCMVVLSPKFVVINSCETEAEKKILRDLYFQEEIKKEAK